MRTASAFSPDQDQIEFERRPGWRGCSRRLAEDDRYAIDLALAFKARGKVHGIADRRIREALVRTHIADDALAGIDADANRQRREGASLRLGFGGKLAVDAIEFGKHGERALAGMIGVTRIVERRVPERHDAVAD